MSSDVRSQFDELNKIFYPFERRMLRRQIGHIDQDIAQTRGEIARYGPDEISVEILQNQELTRVHLVRELEAMDRQHAPVGAAQPVTQALGVSGPAQLATA